MITLLLDFVLCVKIAIFDLLEHCFKIFLNKGKVLHIGGHAVIFIVV